MAEKKHGPDLPGPGTAANAAIYALFLAYALWFLITCGSTLNYEYIYHGSRAFTQTREPWIVFSFFAAVSYLLWVALNFFNSKPGGSPPLFHVFLAALALRLVPAMITFGAATDMSTFELVQRSALSGRWDAFTLHAPYFPFYSYILQLQAVMNRFLGLPDYFFIKLVPVLFDSAAIFLVYAITGRRNYAQKYAWNPLTIMICAVHGQFDAITMFFILLSIYFYEKHIRTFTAGLSFGAAFQSKWWPVMLAPVFIIRIKPKQAVMFLAAWLCVFLLFTLPGPERAAGPGLNPFEYHGVPEHYGISGILHYFMLNILHLKPAFFYTTVYFVLAASIASVSWALYISRKWPVSAAVLFTLLTFYIVCPGWSVQYFAWLAALFFLSGLHRTKLYAAFTALVFLIYFSMEVFDFMAFIRIGHLDAWNLLAFASFFITLAAVPLWLSLLKNKGKIPFRHLLMVAKPGFYNIMTKN